MAIDHNCPPTVLAATQEIDILNARAVARCMSVHEHEQLETQHRLAVQAAMRAYSKTQNAALLAGGAAAERMARDANYTDPWARQWDATAPPDKAESLLELPLWYLAQILKAFRLLLSQDAGEAWESSPKDWARIKAGMTMAGTAIAGASLEVKAQSNALLRAARTEKKKATGPTPKKAKLTRRKVLTLAG
jgi:hypothetical protein